MNIIDQWFNQQRMLFPGWHTHAHAHIEKISHIRKKFKFRTVRCIRRKRGSFNFLYLGGFRIRKLTWMVPINVIKCAPLYIWDRRRPLHSATTMPPMPMMTFFTLADAVPAALCTRWHLFPLHPPMCPLLLQPKNDGAATLVLFYSWEGGTGLGMPSISLSCSLALRLPSLVQPSCGSRAVSQPCEAQSLGPVYFRPVLSVSEYYLS